MKVTMNMRIMVMVSCIKKETENSRPVSCIKKIQNSRPVCLTSKRTLKTYALCLASASASSPLKLGQYNQSRRDPADGGHCDDIQTNILEQNEIFSTQKREDITGRGGVVFLRARLLVVLSAHHNGDCHAKVGAKSVHKN